MPETEDQKEARFRGGLLITIIALCVLIPVSGLILKKVILKPDTPTSATITTKGQWLSKTTHGVISVAGFDGSLTSNQVAHVTFTVGSCHGVQGYATSPSHPIGPGQTLLYMTIPGSDKNNVPDANILISDVSSVRHLVHALLASSLKPCIAGDPRLQQFSTG